MICRKRMSSSSARKVTTTSERLVAPANNSENFTVGRSSRPTKINTNIFQLQENMSVSSIRGHGIKFGGGNR